MFMQFSTVKKESVCDTSEAGCCTPQPKGKLECPQCLQKAKGVLSKTLKSLLKEKTLNSLECLDGFYYCKTASCSTIYFREQSVLTQDDLKVIVGLKDGATPATLCYCFDWTKEKIEAELKASGKTFALDDIKAKMENPGCLCESMNPSGGCCLADVGKAIKEIQSELK